MTSSPSTFTMSSSSSSYYDFEPPFLALGTDVSAKYKGAFCEAKIKKITRLVKCRVTFKNNGGSVIVTDDNVKGPLRNGAHVEAKHPGKNSYQEGIINKVIDASQYTVVFDDGDETTLRRTSLCPKSGKHFSESESLDHLPLTHPEHFGNPVNLGSVKRRKRNIINDREKRDETPTSSVNGERNDDDEEDDKKSSTVTSGRKGKRRGKYARRSRGVKVEADDAEDSANNGEEVQEEKSPSPSANPVGDSETESDTEYDGSKVPSISRDTNNASNTNLNEAKCEFESLDGSPVSVTPSDSLSHTASLKSRRKRNNLIENDKRDDSVKSESAENGAGDEEERKSFNGPVRKGKRRGKFGRKRSIRPGVDEDDFNGDNHDEKGSIGMNDSDTESEAEYDSKIPTISRDVCVEVDDRIRVKYGKGKVVKIYEAKVLKADNDGDLSKKRYFVHYTGWNTRYDEWIKRNRIVEVVREKVTKRKSGPKLKKGTSAPDERHSPGKDDNLSKDVSKEKNSKESVSVSPSSKNVSNVKRGRPSSAPDNKTNDTSKRTCTKRETKLVNKKSRIDPFEKSSNPSKNSSSSLSSSTKNNRNEDRGPCSDNETDSSEPTNEILDSNSNNEAKEVDKFENSISSSEAVSRAELEESTDVDTMEVALENESTKEEEASNKSDDNNEESKEIVPKLETNPPMVPSDDILTCTENLAKSPPMRCESPQPAQGLVKIEPKADIKNEDAPAPSPSADGTLSDDADDNRSSSRFVKRKQTGKQLPRKDKRKARSPESEDTEAKNSTEDDCQFRKKPRKKMESYSPDEDESKKNQKPGKKTRKGANPNDDSPPQSSVGITTITPVVSTKVDSVVSASTPTAGKDNLNLESPTDSEADGEKKGKKRKRFGKVKQSEPSAKMSQAQSENKIRDGQVPKKRFKKELEEKKRKEKDAEKSRSSPEREGDHEDGHEYAGLFDNISSTTSNNTSNGNGNDNAIHNPVDHSESHNPRDMLTCNEVLQKATGSFLLCKEEVPASPPGHQMDLISRIREASSSHHGSSINEDNKHLTSSHLSLSSLPSTQASSLSSPSEGKENRDHASSSIGNRDCSQFTPPTTPESLKSGTLSSSTPPHERERDSDNERNSGYLHNHVPGESSYSASGLEMSKPSIASVISALDSLAHVASGVSMSNKKCNLSSSPAHHSEDSCSRNGIFDSSKGDKLSLVGSPLSSPKKRRGRVRTSSTSETAKDTKSQSGYKTRGACGRKNRQHGDSNDIYSSNETSGGPISPAFPCPLITNYSPNACMNSVFPQSKYNFVTPIDESMEAERRIQVLQDRMQDLRKTYMSIKSELHSIEKRRKRPKRKDSGSPVSPSSSSHEHSNRNPKDHPPELGTETPPSQTCAA
ncbi:uncharacterized protein LOC141857108 [Brevipalpus obovatus]|uniref:uncharacterized protein LOC141857108 n=1 Tax=Brevipalpus obovatus TaxID=246614 RepID=UPI003D9F29A0